jgi:hypothetical protein
MLNSFSHGPYLGKYAPPPCPQGLGDSPYPLREKYEKGEEEKGRNVK